MSFSTNSAGREPGLRSALFAKLKPLRERSLRLKSERPHAYKTLKVLLNSALMTGLMAMIFAVLHVLEAITA